MVSDNYILFGTQQILGYVCALNIGCFLIMESQYLFM